MKINQEVLLIDYAPTERATCKACKATLQKNSLRLGRRIRSHWHDGFDIQYQHFNCGAHLIKHPKDLRGLMDLKWEDIQKCMVKLTRRFLDETNSIVKMYHTRSICCWNLIEKLQMLPVHHLTAALEYNNVWLSDRMKPFQLASIIADGMLFGKFNPCPLCEHASLRQSGPLIYCSGYLETSNSHCPMTYTLHNIFESHDPCVANETLKGFEALDFSRKEAFLLPPILANCDLFKHWQRPKLLPPLPFTSESSLQLNINESDLQSESESESSVPLGKELLGLTFSSLGFVPSEKNKLEQLITNHGGSYVDKLNTSVQLVLLSDNFMTLQNTKRFKEAKLWGIPLLHYDYVMALVSRKKKKPITFFNDRKRTRLNKTQQLPLGLILRRRKYLKYYLKAGEIPNQPYPMIKTLLQSNKSSEHEINKKYTPPDTVEENAALVTIDPWFDKRPGHSIYRDAKNGVYNCTTLYTDVVTGVNKYYNQQLIQLSSPDCPVYYWVFRRWGRVGSNKKSNNEFLCDSFGQDFVSSQKAFEKRALDLTGIPWRERYSNQAKAGRYRYVFLDNKARNPQHVPTTLPLCTLSKELEELIKLIFDQHLMNDTLESQHIDMTKMSLGVISEQQMAQGYQILCDIESVLLSSETLQNDEQSTTYDQQRVSVKGIAKITAYTTQFYSTIPHTFSVERTPPLLDTMKKLRDKILLLEQLMDISIARSIMHNSSAKISCHPFNSYYDALNCTLTKLDPLGDIAKHIISTIQNTHAITHNHFQLKVLDIFSFSRQSDRVQFEAFLKDNGIEKQQMLWHGSRLTNYASILKLGLKAAPENAPTSGYMFGKGIYFADMVSKAAQYCYATADYPHGILVLAQVALGSGLPRFHADTNAAEFCKKEGKLHTWGVGRTKCSEDNNILFPDHTGSQFIKLSAGHVISAESDINQLQREIQGYPSLLYNEYIVYHPNQILIRYIIKVSFHFSTLENNLELSSTSSDTC